MRKPYKIAIASGKGGTGKTTLAVSLFRLLSQNLGARVQLVDCDVEEPNDLIFFDDPEKEMVKDIHQLIPSIDTKKCTFCRKCSEYCEFNAIVVIPPAGFAEVNSSLCHSCGACLVACNEDAITEHPEEIGKLNSYNIYGKGDLIEGRLKIGSAMQTMLIKALKKAITNDVELVLYDAPPGTSCPVVETISDTNYVVLVAEPTLFGLHDFKLMIALVRELGLSFGVVINKAGLGSDELAKYIDQEGITMLGEIPFDKGFAGQYAKGAILETIPESIRKSFENIMRNMATQLDEMNVLMQRAEHKSETTELEN